MNLLSEHNTHLSGESFAERQRFALLGGLGFLAMSLLTIAVAPKPGYLAYLTAFMFWLGCGLGAMVLSMIHHLVGGAWGILTRRIHEAMAKTIPLLAVLSIPVLVGMWMQHLYPWNGDPTVEALHHVQHKQAYLNPTAFTIRFVIYFALWITLSFLLVRWSHEQDAKGSPQVAERLRALSAVGLILYVLTITFASIDWVMSLEPEWFSTIFGLLTGIGQVLTAHAFGLICLHQVSLQPISGLQLSGPALAVHLRKKPVMRDLGNLLLAFVMLWAYLAFSQFLLIYSGNLPEETPWYLKARLAGGWGLIAILLLLLQFVAPFFMLLLRSMKHRIASLASVATLVFVMRFFDCSWVIIPARPGGSVFVLTLAVMAWVGIGGLWLWCFTNELRKMPLLPDHLEALAEGNAHG